MKNSQFLDPKVLARIDNLELLARTVVDGFINGLHHSPYFGLSVDFAIHFIERTRALLRSSDSFAVATEQIFEEPARAIARNAIVIAIGFTPLFFAPLVPYITVGAFMAAIMILSGFSTLVLLPALMSWAGPWLFADRRFQNA